MKIIYFRVVADYELILIKKLHNNIRYLNKKNSHNLKYKSENYLQDVATLLQKSCFDVSDELCLLKIILYASEFFLYLKLVVSTKI